MKSHRGSLSCIGINASAFNLAHGSPGTVLYKDKGEISLG
jgi:hypothetical protein